MAGLPRIALCEIAPSSCGTPQDARPGKRPGEGDVIATRPDGSKVLRYGSRHPTRGDAGAVTECPLWAGLGVEFVKDLPAAGELVERLWRECQVAASSADSAR